jgi:hypothetical protein
MLGCFGVATMPYIVVFKIKEWGGSLELGRCQTFGFIHTATVILLFPIMCRFVKKIKLLNE